jgi:hypothetical protein
MFILIGFIAAIIFSVMMNKLRRRKATYNLFKVRDNFILLVAKNKLPEDSKFFQYFYKRINMFLEHAPNIGLDDALKSFSLSQKADKAGFKASLEKARRDTVSILRAKELQDPEVAAAAQYYYEASKEMVLAHSSLLRIAYYAAKSGVLKNTFISMLPSNTQKGLAVVKLAGEEAECLSHRTGYAH